MPQPRVNIPESDKPRVVIIGAGFAGLLLARRLAKEAFQVVLLDKNNYHQFQPLFYQVAMSGLEPSSIVFPLRKAFQKKKNTFIRVTEVQSIDAKNNRVHTPLGIVNYDFLVIATGADTNYFGNQKIQEKSIPMKSVGEALFLRNAILEDFELSLTTDDYDRRQWLIDIVVVGGGPTGVEVCGALAEMRKYILPKDYPELNTKEIDIYLMQGGPQLLPGMSDQASEKALEFLQNLEVRVQLNTRVVDYDGEYAYTQGGEKIRCKKLIWAAGVRGNLLKGIEEEQIGPGARIKVDRYNRVTEMGQVYAIGDIAYMETEKYPKGHPQVAQAAMQQAKHLAKNLRNEIRKKEWVPFEYRDLGSMATIGRHLAVCDLPRIRFQGAFAWFVWLFVHLFQILGVKNRLFVFLNWVWGYLTYDQSLRLIIRPKIKKNS